MSSLQKLQLQRFAVRAVDINQHNNNDKKHITVAMTPSYHNSQIL